MTEYRFVERLPDLIHPPDYAEHEDGKVLRIQIRVTEDGLEILGDAMNARTLERVLESLDPAVIEQSLCG